MMTTMPSDLELARLRPTQAIVDLDAIENNLRVLRGAVKPSMMVCACVKSNAYGHGARVIAPYLAELGAEWLAVAFLDEGAELRNAGVSAPILVLGAPEPERAAELIEYKLTQTVPSLFYATALSERAVAAGGVVDVHAKLDTGMGRIGFLSTSNHKREEAAQDIARARALPGLRLGGVYAHYATADEDDLSFAYEQRHGYMTAITKLNAQGVDGFIRHTSNSAATARLRGDSMDMVRPGIALYTGDPVPPYPNAGAVQNITGFRQAMTLKTRVSFVKSIAKGVSVGYGRAFVAPERRRIATLPVGYGDGVNRLLSNGAGEVLIRGVRAPIVGRVCMDQLMVDVSGVGEVQIGEEAVLFGAQGGDCITVEEVARKLGTISYEVLCRVDRRVPRVYVRNGAPIAIVNELR